MEGFQAVVVERDGDGQQAATLRRLTESDLMAGEVTVRISHSSVNYKDGLAVTGKLPVVRRWPMVPGIDLAGEVESSRDRRFVAGDQVILSGWGVGEVHLGGWAERARLPAGWLMRRPGDLTASDCMAIGTAGFTAMLCLRAIERAGLVPADGPVVVTGATGGVGSLAVMLLARAGWRVVAVTGKAAEAAFLVSLGAAEVIDRVELAAPGKPLVRPRWVAGVDCVGGQTLVNVLAATVPEGVITACGNVGGMELPASVAPFILRGVSLVGINSVDVAMARRRAVWERLAHSVDRQHLAALTTHVPLAGAIAAAEAIVAGTVRGRIVVDVA